MTDKLVLHEDASSGNCYKARLTAAIVGKPIDRRGYDILQGGTRTSGFLENVNANGRIPVLQVGTRFIPESNAICYYLAEGSTLIPSDPLDHADMLHWMFWEQYNHEPNIATLRFWMREMKPENLTDIQRLQMSGKRHAGNAALKLMDDHLGSHEWFVGDTTTLADICLFAYTHVAEQADFDLKRYPNVSRWIERMKGHPRYIAMDA
jgi:glutathione S-transferase